MDRYATVVLKVNKKSRISKFSIYISITVRFLWHVPVFSLPTGRLTRCSTSFLALHFRRPPCGNQHYAFNCQFRQYLPGRSGGTADHLRPANNCQTHRTWLLMVIAPSIEHFPAASFNILGRHTARLSRQNTGAGYAVLQSVFYVMVFAATTLALLYFLQIFCS